MSQATLSDSGQVFLPKQSANIYTMLLILTFLAISIGSLFLYLEMREYGMSIKVSGDAKVPPPPPPKAVPEPEQPAATPENLQRLQSSVCTNRSHTGPRSIPSSLP